MENRNISIKQIIIKYGLLLALLSIVLFGISYAMDSYIDPPWWISLLGIVITTVVVIYAFKAYKYGNGGFMSYSKAIIIGLGIALITGLIMGVVNYIFITIIEPDFIKESVELFKIHHPSLPAPVENEGIMQPWIMSIGEFVSTVFLGFFISLIIGLIMRTKAVSKV